MRVHFHISFEVDGYRVFKHFSRAATGTTMIEEAQDIVWPFNGFINIFQ
jgi:hypothetical protein